jgi:hypothetical protein
MDLNDPRRRLQVLNQNNPSLRASVAPAKPLQVTTAPAQSLNVQLDNGQAPVTINRDPNTQTQPRALPGVTREPTAAQDALHFLGNSAKTIASPFSYLINTDIVNPANELLHPNDPNAIRKSNENLGLGANGRDITGGLKKLAGNSAEAGLFLIPGVGESRIASLAGKTAFDTGVGGAFGLADTLANDPNATAKDYAKNAVIGGAFGGLARLGFAGLGKLKNAVIPPPEKVGLTQDTLKFVQKSHDAGEIHDLLASIYGGTDDALQAASENIAKSSSKKAIIQELERLPEQGGAAAGISAAVSDAVAREKYGVSPLTGEAAPPPKQAPQGPDVRPLGPQGSPSEGTPEIKLNADHEFQQNIDDALKEAGVTNANKENAQQQDQALRDTPAGHNAKDVVKQPGQVAKAITRVADPNHPDALSTVMNAIAKSPNKSEIRQMVEGLKIPISGTEKNRLVKDLANESDPQKVIERLNKEIDNYYAQAPAGEVPAATPEAAPHTPQSTKQAIDSLPVENGVAPNGARVTQLPPEDAQAIKDAGGTVPEDSTVTAQPTTDNTSDIPNSASDTNPAKDELLSKLDEASKSYNADAKVYSKQRGAALNRGAQAAQDTGGKAGYIENLKALKGNTKKSGFQPLELSQEGGDGLINEIYNHPTLKPAEKLNAATAVMKVIGEADGAPTPSDIKYIRNALGNDVADAVQQHSELAGMTRGEKAAMVAATPKAAMATADLSAPLRQGAVLGTRFPKEWKDAAAEAVTYFGAGKGQTNYDRAMEQIANNPRYELMKKAGLAVDGAEGIVGTEEQFMSSLLETDTAKKLQVGKVVAASDRAYTGFLTKLRSDVFNHIMDNLDNTGIELGEKELKSLGEFINSASGRGNLGSLERHSGLLSKALFSPRLWKSRLDLLNPNYYYQLKGPARKYALQSSASFASVAATVLGLAAAAGATVIYDPRSADFAKIKIGNTRYDILGGLQQNIRLGAQMITGQKINSSTGELQTLGDGITTPTRKDLLYQFFENKENPLVGYASKVLAGKDAGGNPVNPATEFGKLFVPLNAMGVVETAKDRGSLADPKNVATSAAMNLPGFAGAGVQTYGNTRTADTATDSKGNLTFKGKAEDNMVKGLDGKVLLSDKGKPVTVTFPKDATDLEKKAIMDEKRHSALSDAYKKTLSKEDQALMKLSDEKLKEYVKDGSIDQARYDKIQNYQKTADSQGKANNYTVPDGIKSPQATSFYQKWNSMDKKDQDAWLKQGPDANAKSIATEVNKMRSEGLSEFKPSNALTKAYSEYEKDINTHPEYDEIELRRKAKEFQKFAYKQNYSDKQQHIYGAAIGDLKALAANGQIGKDDLNAAIKMDDELWNSGLISSLKFSKTFRSQFGYGLPTGGKGGNGAPGGGSGGSSSSTNAHLSSLIPSFKSSSGSSKPEFSSRNRKLAFRAAGTAAAAKGSGNSKKVNINL